MSRPLELELQMMLSICVDAESQTLVYLSKLLTTSVSTHPALGCGYLVFWTLRWPMEVDRLHSEQRSENSSLLLCSFIILF